MKKINNKTKVMIASAVTVVLLAAGVIVGVLTSHQAAPAVVESTEPVEPTKPASHMIEGVPADLQDELKAGCETHAVTSLLRSLGYDIDAFTFADYYLDCHYVYKDEDTGYMEGPDMNSGFAGTAYAGWGIYAPAMAKCMNNYLSDVKSTQKATALEGLSMPELCERYIDNDIPVAVWATTNMEEPYPFDSWTVNYVDENAKYEIGDTFTWLMHEHCLVLCGYDEREYYFADSVTGDISHFERALCEERYEQLGQQAIVVE